MDKNTNKHLTFRAKVRRMAKEVTSNTSESAPPRQQNDNNILKHIPPVPAQQNNSHVTEEYPSPTQQNNSVPEDLPRCSKVFKPLDSKSKQKLDNSLFSEVESSTKIQQTRSITAKLALRKGTEVHAANGYKIVDFSFLQEHLSAMVAFINCKKRGCIQLLTDPSKKQYGLAENVLIKCEKCGHEKGAYTSRRIEKNGKGSSLMLTYVQFMLQGIGHTG